MPTPDQITEITPSPCDGPITAGNADGGRHTGETDGASRDDNPDGTAVVAFTDGATLTVEAGRSEESTGVNGNELDVATRRRFDGRSDAP
jgi:hypothetical protein